jgi:hypothetical protein
MINFVETEMVNTFRTEEPYRNTFAYFIPGLHFPSRFRSNMAPVLPDLHARLTWLKVSFFILMHMAPIVSNTESCGSCVCLLDHKICFDTSLDNGLLHKEKDKIVYE